MYSVLLTLFITTVCEAQLIPIVHSPQGRILGKTIGETDIFLGIPYAQPPVGYLRFKAPEATIYMMHHKINASEYPPACPQPLHVLTRLNRNPDFYPHVDEDCLYVNVYVNRRYLREWRFVPVMVWIHGGEFKYGSGSIFNPLHLAEKHKVIVTINYRLGLLGFLPDGEKSTLGLQDQIMALRWVQMMAQAFGGNPDLVTIFGEGAGGVSVSLLSVSPKAKGLFKRVIAQSGVANSPLAVVPNYKDGEIVRETLRAYRCVSGTMVCLRRASVEDVVRLTERLAVIQPDVDSEVIMPGFRHNISLVHKNVEFVLGTVADEGSVKIYKACTFGHNFTDVCMEVGINIHSLRDVGALPPGLGNDQARSVILRYNSWYPFPVRGDGLNPRAAAALVTDRGYKLPVNTRAVELSKAGFRVRVYEFNARPQQYSVAPLIPWTGEAQHGDELPFIFGLTMNGTKVTVAKKMMELWTEFSTGTLRPSKWPLFTSRTSSTRGSYSYLYIGDDEPTGVVISPYVREAILSYWNQFWKFGVFPPHSETASSKGMVQPAWLCVVIIVPLVLYWFE